MTMTMAKDPARVAGDEKWFLTRSDLGNGCSATQFVPVLSFGTNGDMNNGIPRGKAKKIVQFSRQPHWLAERPNPVYGPFFKWIMRYVPLAMRLYRFYIYADMELDFFGFYNVAGRKIRERLTRERIEYMKRTAPAKYHEALTPKTELGCKRKINDTDYFACLHNENMELVHADPIEEITATGVRTRSGREIRADAIILANGFETQRVLYPLDIRGEKGISLTEHVRYCPPSISAASRDQIVLTDEQWDRFSAGAAEAYYGTCISSFPNFFVMMGPNTTTGHLSVIYSTECQINFSLRLLKPILQPRRFGLLPSFLSCCPVRAADTVSVTAEAERRDNEWIQRASRGLVWMTGCTSWYVDARTGRNTMLYPDWQFKYWWRSVFIPYSRDFVFRTSPLKAIDAPPLAAERQRRGRQRRGTLAKAATTTAVVTSGLGVALGVSLALGLVRWSDVEDALDQVKGWSSEVLGSMHGLLASGP